MGERGWIGCQENYNKMQSTNRKANENNGQQVPKLKERHIVSWSQEEDDILRERIRIHGTENWAIIASNFKDKTTRQCRRRWFTYLNSDFKKGGWSEEEDMLLCEAQKVFGNRWTEIAKVVSGRTDNAVKNRFTTLCKKRAKHDALAKENSTSSINLSNKSVIFPHGISETERPLKRMRRTNIENPSENPSHKAKSHGECGTTRLHRAPFVIIGQNFSSQQLASNFSGGQQLAKGIKEAPSDAINNNSKGTFLKKDDPKILALMQQAELLTSLAAKANSENTDQSIENAWKIFQESFNQTKENEDLSFKSSEMNSYLEHVKDLVGELKCSNEANEQSWRQPDLYDDSSTSSEYSSGSSLPDNAPHGQAEPISFVLCERFQGSVPDIQSTHSSNQHVLAEGAEEISGSEFTSQAHIVPAFDETKIDSIAATCGDTNVEFSSPIQETPMFRTMAAAIPSPKFTESERHFLMRALGMESTITNPSSNLSQPPACKRALLQSL